MRTLTLPVAALLLTASPLSAQIEFPGEPLSAAIPGRSNVPVVDLPAVDVDALMAEDAGRAAQGVKGPYRFGYNHTVDLDLANSGAWTDLPNGDRVWRIGLHCPGAYSINFVFGEYVVPEGAQIFVTNDAGERLGAFTAASAAGRTEMGVTQLGGDRIQVEYDEPAAVAGQGHLKITQVTHAYRDIVGGPAKLNESGSCNNNTICPEGDPWHNEIAAVAMITVGGSGLCSGTLINNCAQDGTPYFLTANHCTTGENPGTWVFRFKWESPTCTPTANAPTNKTVSGATLLAHGGGSDYALLQLNSTPPASYQIYYAGWDNSGTAPQNSTCIHHPSGDIKKITFDHDAATTGNFDGAQCWHISMWDDGTTEPGSSGSCLLNQDHHIIGQLFGGQADCSFDQNDYFGRFNVTYPNLQQWLGSCGTTLDGFDPNQPQGITVPVVDAPSVGVQPNPGNGLFTITLPANVRIDALIVRDATGREVLRQRPGATTSLVLDLGRMPEGAYTLEAQGPAGRLVQRLVVQR